MIMNLTTLEGISELKEGVGSTMEKLSVANIFVNESFYSHIVTRYGNSPFVGYTDLILG
jgi:hypothetical protein